MKKKVESPTVKTPALSPAQYWEWRTTISELDVAKSNYKISELELKLIQKDAEMLATRAQLFSKTRVELFQKSLSDAQAEYLRFKEVLEKDLGISLSNKIIDDITFEVRDVPNQNEQKTP